MNRQRRNFLSESLCRTYWRPIYGLYGDRVRGTEEAEDLTQGFFALILERKDLNSVRQEKGRLRSSPAFIVEKFSGRRIAPCDGSKARQRPAFNSVR